MLRKVSYALVVTAILLVAAVPSVIAQYDFAMSVGINLANLDPNNGANIGVTYYPVNTATAPTTISDSIPAGGATKYFPIPVSDGFTGSVVISSDTQIAAIVNEISSGYSGSYNGFSEGNTSFYAPIIMRANGGYDTEISVQNAGSGTASVGIEFVAGTSGTDYTMPDFDVEEGRAVRVYQGTQTQLGTKFVGAATITADKPVVVIVNQINNTAKTLLVYGGFPSGSNRVAVAQVQHNNADYNTGIQVQNVHATNPATVTVTYGPNAKPGGTAFTPGVETAYVMPGETAVFNQWGNNHGYDWNSAPAYVGAAIVSSTQGNVPLVVNVNVLKGTAPAQASAYEGLDADAPSTNFSAKGQAKNEKLIPCRSGQRPARNRSQAAPEAEGTRLVECAEANAPTISDETVNGGQTVRSIWYPRLLSKVRAGTAGKGCWKRLQRRRCRKMQPARRRDLRHLIGKACIRFPQRGE
jgi:hypothetical protein